MSLICFLVFVVLNFMLFFGNLYRFSNYDLKFEHIEIMHIHICIKMKSIYVIFS